jgi:UDP-N-acetylglucosamine--N-acetylmuramyl-(pentapeptide) pyrophosphoryl-undecaprenol N-acetylglucosamine transferase
VDEFIDDMGSAYQWADLVLCRAGAMTVAELCLAAVPAILVPFPYAAGDHQSANARYLSDHQAAIFLKESELNQNRVEQILDGLLADRSTLAKMSARARELGRPDATEKVSAICMEVMHA